MWEKLRIVFTIPELRFKVLLTMGLLAVYRLGSRIPLPFVNQSGEGLFSKQSQVGKVLEQVATFGASNVDQMTIFGLGIMPYISASIIFQLLGSVYKPLEELQKEGEVGRKRINQYTRIATVFICLLQSWWYLGWLSSQDGAVRPEFQNSAGGLTGGWFFISLTTMTAGTMFLMWLGELIDDKGIGNGISLLIMAGILTRIPKGLTNLFGPLFTGEMQIDAAVRAALACFLFVAIIFGVVFITQGQRRIPTQSAKHVRGRRVYGGTRQFLPLRVNQSGVMPIIFASSLLIIPTLIFQGIYGQFGWDWASVLQSSLGSSTSFLHNVAYVALIYFFCYFWTAITFNPKDMAENLKSFGTFIPGYRPGRRTAEYLEKVMVKITYVGGAFLALVAIIPALVSSVQLMDDDALFSLYGGTSVLIAVSVVFDLVQKIDSHLVMRNYSGLLE